MGIMKKYPLRARFKKDIICEFVVPNKKSNKVIIVCGGMPGYPGNVEMLFWLSRRGYWVFSPRYRGTWESAGKFLQISPHKDVLDVIQQLPKGFRDLWSRKILKIKNPQIYLIGSSFGAPAVILASRSPKVKKAVAFSPVIDWLEQDKNEVEPIDFLARFISDAFGQGYRFVSEDWKKLKSGKFYNPAAVVKNLDSKKIFLIHAKNDKVTPFGPVKKFVKILGCKYLLLNKGGHMSVRNTIKPEFWRKIRNFLKK